MRKAYFFSCMTPTSSLTHHLPLLTAFLIYSPTYQPDPQCAVGLCSVSHLKLCCEMRILPDGLRSLVPDVRWRDRIVSANEDESFEEISDEWVHGPLPQRLGVSIDRSAYRSIEFIYGPLGGSKSGGAQSAMKW